jgi:hypothetical protein
MLPGCDIAESTPHRDKKRKREEAPEGPTPSEAPHTARPHAPRAACKRRRVETQITPVHPNISSSSHTPSTEPISSNHGAAPDEVATVDANLRDTKETDAHPTYAQAPSSHHAKPSSLQPESNSNSNPYPKLDCTFDYQSLPSPPNLAIFTYDAHFGNKVTEALRLSLYRTKLRARKYGKEVVRRYKVGYTPQEVRDKHQAEQEEQMRIWTTVTPDTSVSPDEREKAVPKPESVAPDEMEEGKGVKYMYARNATWGAIDVF